MATGTGAAPPTATNLADLAAILGVSRQLLNAWKKRKDAPKAAANGTHDVAAWREFMRRNDLKGGEPATQDAAKDQSESRLQKLFDECIPVRSLYPANRHKKRNNTIHFANGMTLWVLGANNKTNLQRRSIRWLIMDECWRAPTGHMAEAEARVTAFGWLGKCLFMSQGGEEDDDTHRKFETTSMREWTFACPHCHHRQPFRWEQVEWSKDARDESGEWDFQQVFIDAGYATYDVYRECATHGWTALMGDRRATFTHKVKGRKSVERFYSPRRKVVLGRDQSCSVFYWSNLNIKDTLARLRRNQNPDNGPVWEVPDDIDEDYLAQMESEHRIKKNGKWLWERIGSRPNHLWDAESMQVAAATMLKIVGREAISLTPVDTPDEEP